MVSLSNQHRLKVAAVLAALTLSEASPASAQSAPPATSAEDSTLAEIIVTAQKRSERLEDVPISITAIDANTLRTAGVTQLTDISAVTPGLQFQSQGGFTQPMIRGVGTSIVSPGSGSNVGLYLDGFLLPNPATTNLELLNVSSVEVLKGPQGTLFGHNTTGGAILIATAEPSIEPSVRAQLSYGSYNAQTYEGYVTGGLGEKLALDTAAIYRTGDGWIRNIVTGQEAGKYSDVSVRVGAKFNVTDNFYLLLRYSYSHVNDPYQVEHGVLCCNAQGKPYSLAAYIPGAIIGTAPNEVSSAEPVPFKAESNAVQLTAAADLGFAKLTSYTQYRNESAPQGVDLAASSIPIESFYFPYGDKIFTQEFILNSTTGGPLQYASGLYYFSDIASANTTGSFGGAPSVFIVHAHDKVTSVAAYADATYQLSDRFFLTAGLRASKDEYSDAYDNIGAILGGPGQVRISSISNGFLTPRVVLRYKPDDRSSVYASFTSGYKSALRNIAAESSALISPERISAYEVGYKLATRAFSLDLATYYYHYKDLQVASYHGDVAIVNNAATARVYGFEGDLRYHLNSHIEVTAGAAYTNAEYTSFPGAPLYAQCLQASCGIGTFPNATIDLHDSPIQFAPKFSGNIGARYSTPLARGQFTLSGNLSYTTKEYFDSAALFANTSHENLAIRAEWVDPSQHYTIALFGENLTNKRYLTQIQPNSVAVVTSWDAPATVGVSIGAKF